MMPKKTLMLMSMISKMILLKLLMNRNSVALILKIEAVILFINVKEVMNKEIGKEIEDLMNSML